jgi:hypothetical protein
MPLVTLPIPNGIAFACHLTTGGIENRMLARYEQEIRLEHRRISDP